MGLKIQSNDTLQKAMAPQSATPFSPFVFVFCLLHSINNTSVVHYKLTEGCLN